MARGRPRKPTELKILQGTFRKGQDTPLTLIPDLSGEVERQSFPDHAARQMWNTVVQKLIDSDVLKPTDVPMARSMCEFWGLYCASHKLASKNPTDPGARTAVCSYWQRFEQAASRFGMTPSDRSRLRLDKPPERVRGRLR